MPHQPYRDGSPAVLHERHAGLVITPTRKGTCDEPPLSRVGDAKHLRTFREEYGRRSRPGLVLHTGDAIEWLAPGVLEAPWWKVL